MEINISKIIHHLIEEVSPRDYSASVAELGPNAGAFTWGNAVEDALPLFGEYFDREDFDAHFAGFGAWDAEELAAHSDEECAALMLQFIAGDWREALAFTESAPLSPDFWTEYEGAVERGILSGRFDRGADDAGAVYYYIGV